MPIYEFKCKKCGTVFEYLLFKSDDNYAPCPSCGADNAERILSTFSSVSSSSGQGYSNVSNATSCGSSGGFS